MRAIFRTRRYDRIDEYLRDTELVGRHKLYEINYGSTPEIRRYRLFGAVASANANGFKGSAEQYMAEYDLDEGKLPDLSDPGTFNYDNR